MPDYSNSLRVPVRCACCGSNAENRGEARHDEGSDEDRHERNRKADQVSFPLYGRNRHETHRLDQGRFQASQRGAAAVVHNKLTFWVFVFDKRN